MAGALTRVNIANLALAKFGAGAIGTFADATPAGTAVSLVFDEVVNGLLAEYPWSFAKQTRQLQQVAEPFPASDVGPVAGASPLAEGWRYAYQLPGDLLASPEKYLTSPRMAEWTLRRFEVQGTTLYCDAPYLWCVGAFRVDPSAWPATFVTAAVACLAAELVMPISGNAGVRESLQQEAWGTPAEARRGGKLGLAKLADARNAGGGVLRQAPLVDCRWG